MSSFLGSSQFVSETVNLFRDEESAKQHAKVVEWLNSLSTAAPAEKVELLIKLREVLLSSCLEMLEESLEHILSLAHDANMEVRKQVVIFLEGVCQQQIQLLPQIINVITTLLRDRAPHVIKRVIQACISIYKLGLQWISSHHQLSEGIEQTWHLLSVLKAQILDLIDNENEGVRTIAIRFLESVVILQSYPDEDSEKKANDFSLEDMPEYLKMIKRQKLEQEAHDIFDILLKLHAATHVSAATLISCVRGLANIAKLRPAFMGAVVEAYKELLNNKMPPMLSNSQVSNVRKHLKNEALILLKQRGAYEYQTAIKHMLQTLGVSAADIQRAIPKMDKQEQARRQKRILDSVNESTPSKRMCHGSESATAAMEAAAAAQAEQTKAVRMIVDEQELQKQRTKCFRVNEKFLSEYLRVHANVITLVLEFLPKLTLPDGPAAVQHAANRTLPEMLSTICKTLAEQMTEQKIGPGADAFSKQPPMRAARAEDTPQQQQDDGKRLDRLENEEQRKEEATKKLRENMERVRGEQELVERMKQRVKSLKLQEITKPLSRAAKEKFLQLSVQRLLNAEKVYCMGSDTSYKRIKLLANIAATFPDNVRYEISEYILGDIKEHFSLALSWLYEEYNLYLGYTRHTYVKSENRPDHAYNELMNQLIDGINNKYEQHDRSELLQRLYLFAPTVSDAAFDKLLDISMDKEFHEPGLYIIRKLAMLRMPRRTQCVDMLLTCCVHEFQELRELALTQLQHLFGVHEAMQQQIEQFALKWSGYLAQHTPPFAIFGKEYGRVDITLDWQTETIKSCLSLLLLLLVRKPKELLPKLGDIFAEAQAEVKRQILRSIDVAMRALGADNPALLQFISDCAKGTEALLVRIVYVICDRNPAPSRQLVERVRNIYGSKINDPRIIIPLLHGLTREQVLELLPNFIQLNMAFVKDVLSRLLRIGEDFAKLSSPVTAVDLLFTLNLMDGKVSDVKCVLNAITFCLAEKQIYTQTVLEQLLLKLSDVQPMPKLLMRTLLQSLSLHTQLADFAVRLLQRLVNKQIWHEHDVLWKGFLKCCQHLKPKSMEVLINLPAAQLQNALLMCPDLRAPLQMYVESVGAYDASRAVVTMQKIEIIAGLTSDVFITDESGGYIKPENIKKEIEDVCEISTITTMPTAVVGTGKTSGSNLDASQPLPPGED